MTLLTVENLSVRYQLEQGELTALQSVSFALEAGSSLGIVGESGSGKTQIGLAIMGMLDSNAQLSGHIHFAGMQLTGLNNQQYRSLRGARIALVFQNPMSALNPYLSIATQMTEILQAHQEIARRPALKQSIALLEECGIADAAHRIKLYPHQFSGGMRQRILIAMALLCQPDLLIADEPTTALDVSTQGQILSLLEELRQRYGISILMISHDLGVVARLCDQVMVLYGGQVMEYGSSQQVLKHAQHPYTRGLLTVAPSLTKKLGGNKKLAITALAGEPPDALQLPAGCPFVTRCSERVEQCQTVKPIQSSLANQHRIYCHALAANR